MGQQTCQTPGQSPACGTGSGSPRQVRGKLGCTPGLLTELKIPPSAGKFHDVLLAFHFREESIQLHKERWHEIELAPGSKSR